MKRPASSTALGMAFAASLALQAPSCEAWSTPSASLVTPASSRRVSSLGTTPQQSPSFLSMYSRRGESSSHHDTSMDVLSRNAVAVDAQDFRTAHRLPKSTQQQQQPLLDFWMPVLSSALLVTGNTFGAGSLVLPQLAAEPGLGPSAALFGLAYLVNLVSGLCFANVAIQQFETSEDGDDVPSSFKEFVQTNLNSPALAVIISIVSFLVNSLVFSFDMSRVGVVFSSLVDPTLSMSLWGATLWGLMATLSPSQMSQAASVCVMVLFGTFGSLLLPGLASLTNPLADWFTPGTAALTGDPSVFWHSLSEITPVIVMSMVFQNIVPSVVKMLDYDRTKTTTALCLGSLLPLAMYVSWCWACLGQGGIDLTTIMSGIDSNPLLTVFSLATLMGSSIGCSLSCASELDIFVKQAKKEATEAVVSPKEEETDNSAKDERFQIPSALATVALPFGVNMAFSNGGDLIGALHVAGGLGTPLLYGTIPVLMTLKQQERQQSKEEGNGMFANAGLGVLGVASTGMLCGNLLDVATDMIAPAVLPTAMAATSAVGM
eukprot:CAMPEP_0172449332 /NCGR_PEP_ID=MMETSP1065-20121228/8070_1 /TAXON_ID=265537 /ORGANISM="Amphiprora paludosa, Strain CCMP125" /LENGTH=545 /DNA_ID=CAMNT_0013200991 /DNA_START=33 /DNA_END=1670 /DNA_ORIENTATION=+